MTEIIVPHYTKHSGRHDEMRSRDPLDADRVKFLDCMLIPKEILDDISNAAEKCGLDIPHYVIARAGMAAIYDLSGSDND